MKIFKIGVMMIIAAIVFSVIPAMAQDSDQTKAKNLAKAGILLTRKGRYKEALQLLQRSQKLGNVLGVNWNIGRCYEHLGKLEKALPYFQAFLHNVKDTAYEGKAGKKIREVQKRIRLLKRQVHLRIIPAPPDATVIVDGARVKASVLRGGSLTLQPGRHKVLVRRSGYRNRKTSLYLAPGKHRTLKIRLKKLAHKHRLTAHVPIARHPKTVVRPSHATPVIAKKAPWKPMEYSKIKTGLFWGGIAALGAAGMFNIWGYAGWKHVVDGQPSMAEVDSARSSAQWKLYTAYAMYGVGAACIITSFFVGHGKHPLGFAAVPTGKDGGALVITGTW